MGAAVGSVQQADKTTANARPAAAAAAVVGVWNVAVTVVDCTTGALIRKVQSVQMYHPDGAFTETTNTGTRGSSIGYWYQEEGQIYGASYFFFRYNPDGSFLSFAKAANAITLSADNSQFTVSATIKDYDANNNLLSTGCVSQTADTGRACGLGQCCLCGASSGRSGLVGARQARSLSRATSSRQQSFVDARVCVASHRG